MIPVEPISLTIGAVALASLFSLCVECFDLIEIGKNLGTDGNLLVIKLSIEKRRLMIWGESVGVLRPDTNRDSLLDEPETRQLVERILNNIQRLFCDADALKAKYGLETSTSQSDALVSTVEGSSVCASSFDKSAIVQFQAKLLKYHRGLGLGAKIKWAIRDLKKFTLLVQNLKDLLDGLGQITTSTATTVLKGQLIRGETESIPDLSTLRVIEHTCSDADWRSSATTASEYFTSVGRLTVDKQKDITSWMDTSNDPIVDGWRQRQQQGYGDTSAPDALGSAWNHPERIIEYQPAQQLHVPMAYIPRSHIGTNFGPLKEAPVVTRANLITASSIMRTITLPVGVRSRIAVYCPPRMRYIHMALAFLDERITISPNTECRFRIRIDDRLLDQDTSFNEVHKRMSGYLEDINDSLYAGGTMPTRGRSPGDSITKKIIDSIDTNWLEQRVDILDLPSHNAAEDKLDWHTIFRQSKDDELCAGIIIMAGEPACWNLFNTSPVLPPVVFRDGRVFRLRELQDSHDRSKYRYKAEHHCNVAVDREFEALVRPM